METQKNFSVSKIEYKTDFNTNNGFFKVSKVDFSVNLMSILKITNWVVCFLVSQKCLNGQTDMGPRILGLHLSSIMSVVEIKEHFPKTHFN